jgi:hypothetical protein
MHPATGRTSRVRTVTTFVGPDTFTLELTYADTSETAGRSVLLTHRRKSPSTPERHDEAPGKRPPSGP